MLTAVAAQPTEKDAKVLLAELDLEFCKRSAAFFIFRHCRTLNPRPDEARGETLVSLFPRYRYIWLLIKSFEEHVRAHGKSDYSGITIISKSRQLIISWLYCALFMWEAMFRPGRTTLFHSTDEYRVGFGGTGDMEQCLLGRVLFMYDNLPDYIKDRCPMRRQNSPHPTMTFYHPAQKGMAGDYLMSRIIGIPDVPHRILNTFAPTGIFDDEVSLQLKPSVFYQAAVPTIGLNCRYVIVATATAAVPESRTWFRDLWYGADSSDDPDKAEPEPEEIMPLEDLYTGCILNDIRAGDNDILDTDRLLGRRKRDKAVTFMLWFNADPRKGRTFAADERAKLTEAQFEQEYNNNWEISESSRLVWRIEEKPYRFRRVQYDPKQTPPFDVLYVAVDGGGHAAATFCQKQQHPRAVKGYTFAILGELDQPGAHAPVFYRELFRRWLEWFGRVPYRCFPDVAGKQEGWRDRTTDIRLMTKIAQDVFDKNFTTYQQRIGRVEGIAEIGEKCTEIIGYEEDNTPIPGMVINPERAPVTARALKGALLQDAEGRISKGKGNTRYEHVADCIRYTSFRTIRYEDIVKPSDLLVKPPPPETRMTRNQRIAVLLERQADQAEQAAKNADPRSHYRRIYQEVGR